MNNFFQRLITGVLYVATTVAAIVLHPATAAVLFGIGAFLSQREFLQTFNGTSKPHIGLSLFSGVFIYVLISLHALSFIKSQWLGFLFLPIIAIFIAELYRNQESPFQNIGTTIISFVYVVAPFSLLNYIYQYGESLSEYAYQFILAFFILVWINDTLAYVTGLLAGRHKLFPRISPKKTWEGFFGGFLFSLAAGYGLFVVFLGSSMETWLGYAAIVAIFATFGDLVESMLKRNFEVKDSGNILPGHGGMLDRFDGVLLASPAVYLYLKFII